jgi:hypothetical protein
MIAPSIIASPRMAPGPKTFFNNLPLVAIPAVLTNCLAAFLSPAAAAFFASFKPSVIHSTLFAKPIRPPSAFKLI